MNKVLLSFKAKNLAILFLALTLFLITPLHAAADENTPQLQKTSEIYTYSGSDITFRIDYHYDEGGNLISAHGDVNGTKDEYYTYYADGIMKQRNLIPVVDIYTDDWFTFPYETHYDKYGTQIEWYVNYYTHASHRCMNKGIPYVADKEITREYNEDGQIISFDATGPVVVGYFDEESHSWDYADHVDVHATYQYDIQGRILYYTITRTDGDYSNDGFFDYHEDGGYTQYIRIFNREGKLISWCMLTFDEGKNVLREEIHLWGSAFGFDYEQIETYEFTYDEHGRITSERWLYEGQEQGARYAYTDTPEKTVIDYYNGWNNLAPSNIRVEILYNEYGYETERRHYTGEDLWYTVMTEYQFVEK